MNNRMQIIHALDFIEEHICEDITLTMIVKASDFSKPQFYRLFTACTGFTPMNYVIFKKIQHAAVELKESNKSILEIALTYGFHSHDVFIRVFKKVYGIVPRAYRKSTDNKKVLYIDLSYNIYFERMRQHLLQKKQINLNWSCMAENYLRYREIFPEEYYDRLHGMGLGSKNQIILDLCTGTGNLPKKMQRYGGEYIGIDNAANMIECANKASYGLERVAFQYGDVHDIPFTDQYFDVVTAQQCWVYLDKARLIPELNRVLKPGGELFIMFMTWLPEEDDITSKTFDLIRKRLPEWNSFSKRIVDYVPSWSRGVFERVEFMRYDALIPFQHATWIGRLKATYGIGDVLSDEELLELGEELYEELGKEENEEFEILHEIVIMKYRKI